MHGPMHMKCKGM